MPEADALAAGEVPDAELLTPAEADAAAEAAEADGLAEAAAAAEDPVLALAAAAEGVATLAAGLDGATAGADGAAPLPPHAASSIASGIPIKNARFIDFSSWLDIRRHDRSNRAEAGSGIAMTLPKR
ncbi:MAG: hypothetical protein JOZ39_06210 [Chloroflexi bacterium]|nr:hypothetical protein [Chloroflexota bacterium]